MSEKEKYKLVLKEELKNQFLENELKLFDKNPFSEEVNEMNKTELTTINKQEIEKKSIFQKIISEFRAGTMINSIFNISIISLGSGVFAIPIKVQYMTLIFTPVYVILAGIANLMSLLMISYVVDKTNILDFFQVLIKF